MEIAQADPINLIRAAHIYDAAGQRDLALSRLQKAYREHNPWLPTQWFMPMVSDELRADPRFHELMRRTGNPWVKFPPNRGSLASAIKKQL